MIDLLKFYADLTPYYHLLYLDWEGAIQRQAAAIDKVIQNNWGKNKGSLLDVSCGIGTQSLGLAELGYQVTASDISPDEVERAKEEAQKRELDISFSVADMRLAYDHYQKEFDILVALDNAVPHLLTENEILAAFQQFYRCLKPGGGCIISVRDYEKLDLSEPRYHHYGKRDTADARWFIFQYWEPRGEVYDFTIYFLEDRGEHQCQAYAMHSTYRNITISRLIELMTESGFVDVARLDDAFFQPLIIGTKPEDG